MLSAARGATTRQGDRGRAAASLFAPRTRCSTPSPPVSTTPTACIVADVYPAGEAPIDGVDKDAPRRRDQGARPPSRGRAALARDLAPMIARTGRARRLSSSSSAPARSRNGPMRCLANWPRRGSAHDVPDRRRDPARRLRGRRRVARAPCRMRLFAALISRSGVDDLSRRGRSLSADLLIVLGGPIGVYETDAYPFLVEEIAAIRAPSRAAKGRSLGVCLGAQLMAAALGARVAPGPGKEIGYAPVDADRAQAAPRRSRRLEGLPVLHWHGDNFELPPGAERLASTPLCPHPGVPRSARRALACSSMSRPIRHAIESLARSATRANSARPGSTRASCAPMRCAWRGDRDGGRGRSSSDGSRAHGRHELSQKRIRSAAEAGPARAVVVDAPLAP